jgi:multisubunit Na+/H+ antiporter MnhB subunit
MKELAELGVVILMMALGLVFLLLAESEDPPRKRKRFRVMAFATFCSATILGVVVLFPNIGDSLTNIWVGTIGLIAMALGFSSALEQMKRGSDISMSKFFSKVAVGSIGLAMLLGYGIASNNLNLRW